MWAVCSRIAGKGARSGTAAGWWEGYSLLQEAAPSCGLSVKGPSSEKEEGWLSAKFQNSKTSWILGMSVSLTLRKEDRATPTLPIARSYHHGNPLVPVNARATDCSPSLIHRIMQCLSLTPEMKGGEINPSALRRQTAVRQDIQVVWKPEKFWLGPSYFFIAQFHSNFQAMFSKTQVGSSCTSMCGNTFPEDPCS